ncbi:MAG TPA: rhomboid family intramembrane serine protease [Candidatus Limnocylindrales bacterium]|nr:rhomboid family intramembrane serine protease [Candidatus Limnocylindrales bacterium]
MSHVPADGPLARADAVALIRQADELARTGDYHAAVPFYRRLVGHADPEIHVAALLGLGECHFRLDQDAEAVTAWEWAIHAPETSLTWLAWRRLAERRVLGGDLGGATDAYRQAERRAPPEERAAIAARLGWLSKELGQARAARGHFARARAGGAEVPAATYVILALTLGIGATEFLAPDVGAVWLQLFGLDKAAVARGELYRLLSVVLVHDPGLPIHLLSNMYALYLVGPLVEGLYGRWRFLTAYVVTAVAGSVASFVFTPNDSVGASGAIFGLFGLLFVALRVHHPPLARARGLASQIGILIVLNLVLGLTLSQLVDNAAHVGGLLAGGWLALLLPPRGASRGLSLERLGIRGPGPGVPVDARLSNVLRAAGLALLAAVIAAGVMVGTEARRGEPPSQPVGRAAVDAGR